MKTKHTPAPWEVFEHSWSNSGIYGGDKNSKNICNLSIYDEATEETQNELTKEMDANAKLIAAAPELLESLELLLETCEYSDANHEEYNAAVAAIAKAKGITPCTTNQP